MIRTSSRTPALDLLRAIAIFLVFLWHYRRFDMPGSLDGIARFGWTGVDLFFVLSGFLIASQLFKKKLERSGFSVGDFYLSRALRILPAYLVVLAIYYLWPVFSEREGMAPAWKFLTFTMNFGLDYRNAGAFSHAWSLCIEEQFYFLFPLLLIVLWKLKSRAATTIVILSIFIAGFWLRMYSWNTYVAPVYDGEDMGAIGDAYSKFIYYPSYNRMDGLLFGVTIALLTNYNAAFKRFAERFAWVFFLGGIGILLFASMIAAEPFAFRTAVYCYPLVALGFAAVVLACSCSDFFLNRFRFRGLTWIALISYSMYLTHKQINHLLHQAFEGFELNAEAKFILCLCISVIGGSLLFLLVEKPFLLLRARWLEQKK